MRQWTFGGARGATSVTMARPSSRSILASDGKSLIHPNQIALCHRAFAPDDAEVERAKALVAAFRGGAERFGNEMIERMHVTAAQRVLERAGD